MMDTHRRGAKNGVTSTYSVAAQSQTPRLRPHELESDLLATHLALLEANYGASVSPGCPMY